MTIRPGELWVADIRFTDASASKRRPVLVLWLDASDVVVAAVTSASARTASDEPLVDWQSEGLLRPSTVRLARLDCLEQSLLLHRIGAVSANDAQRRRTAWDTHVKPQF
jgi:mRNA interferase MazF